MEIILNNRNEKFDFETLTISELLIVKKFSFPRIIVKINGQLIKKDKYKSITIVDKDKVDIIHMISGG